MLSDGSDDGDLGSQVLPKLLIHSFQILLHPFEVHVLHGRDRLFRRERQRGQFVHISNYYPIQRALSKCFNELSGETRRTLSDSSKATLYSSRTNGAVTFNSTPLTLTDSARINFASSPIRE